MTNFEKMRKNKMTDFKEPEINTKEIETKAFLTEKIKLVICRDGFHVGFYNEIPFYGTNLKEVVNKAISYKIQKEHFAKVEIKKVKVIEFHYNGETHIREIEILEDYTPDEIEKTDSMGMKIGRIIPSKRAEGVADYIFKEIERKENGNESERRGI